MQDDASEPFEQDGPGLFDEGPTAAPDGPLVTQEPDDGLEDDPEDEVLMGGAGDPTVLDPEEADDAATSIDAAPVDLQAAESDADAPSTPGAPTTAPVPSAAEGPGELAAPAARHQPRAVDEAPAAPLALYRRYRPETFAEVIGQEHVTDPLQRALQNNKVNHAYLFSGPRGCGKTTSARILARCLNCEKGPTPEPCGECQSCKDLARGGNGSIDVIEIDAASHGGVDDARDLRERAFFAPVHSRYKIYIIDEAHMVTAQGFNAMLKLVEEPPPHVKFIFATTEPEKVIGTIRSRTHHYPFRLVPPKVLQGYLAQLCQAEGVSVDQSVLPLVVRAGAGSVRDSLSVLDQLLGGAAEQGVSYEQASALLGYTPDALLDEIMDAFAAGDSAGVFATIDKVIEVGQDPRRFAEDLLRRLRDLVIVAAVPDAVASGLIDVSGDQAERLETQANGLGRGELTRAAEVIATGLTDMRGTTAPRLHLELMCSRVLLPGADVDGRGIHARLDRLERRMGMVGGAPDTAPADQGRWEMPEPTPQGPVGPQAARAAAQASRAPQPAGPSEPAPGQRPAPAPTGAPAPGNAQAPDVPPAAGQPAQQRPAPGPETAGQPMTPQTPQSHQPQQAAGQRPAAGAGQRPAGPPPGQGQRPAGPPPGQGQRPATAGPQAPQPQQPSPAQGPAARGTLSVADVRRLWPQVLDEVKNRKRFAWILLSQNAQVVDVSDGVLVLGFTSTGARDRFASGGTQDVLRDCMVQVMGADLRIEPILEAGGGRARTEPSNRSQPRPAAPDHAPGGAPAGQPPAAQAPSGPAPAGPAPSGPGDRQAAAPAVAPRAPYDDMPPPDPEDAPPPDPRDEHEPPATSRWTQQARQSIRPTAAGPSAPEAEVDESQLVSEDDESLDESGESAAELITRALGGVVIAEGESQL
ncbi:DNA polymerase III subunit gamma and tau [Luteococcus sp. OSA5]|uniref:DNA polymerase III subunit gamma and tau n=1 Tax=Luteococcus sp. OSA5 TaxID=3401630 RepID=UPI003B43CBB3